MSLYPVQEFHSCRQLIEFARKPNVSIIEKTLRIAAAFFLAIPAILCDLIKKCAHSIQNKLTSHPRPQEIALHPPRQVDLSTPPPYGTDDGSMQNGPLGAPPPYSEDPAIFPSAPSIDLLTPSERALYFPGR